MQSMSMLKIKFDDDTDDNMEESCKVIPPDHSVQRNVCSRITRNRTYGQDSLPEFEAGAPMEWMHIYSSQRQ